MSKPILRKRSEMVKDLVKLVKYLEKQKYPFEVKPAFFEKPYRDSYEIEVILKNCINDSQSELFVTIYEEITDGKTVSVIRIDHKEIRPKFKFFWQRIKKFNPIGQLGYEIETNHIENIYLEIDEFMKGWHDEKSKQ